MKYFFSFFVLVYSFGLFAEPTLITIPQPIKKLRDKSFLTKDWFVFENGYLKKIKIKLKEAEASPLLMSTKLLTTELESLQSGKWALCGAGLKEGRVEKVLSVDGCLNRGLIKSFFLNPLNADKPYKCRLKSNSKKEVYIEFDQLKKQMFRESEFTTFVTIYEDGKSTIQIPNVESVVSLYDIDKDGSVDVFYEAPVGKNSTQTRLAISSNEERCIRYSDLEFPWG